MPLPNTLDGVAILDCTLRDGGYYTSWDFRDAVVVPYLESLSRLPVETVELGYCSSPNPTYLGKFAFVTPQTTEWAKALLSPDQRLAVMIDEKSTQPHNLARLLIGHRGLVDIVRIATTPARLNEAADLAETLRDLGFEVGINVMQLSRYWDAIESLEGLARAGDTAGVISLVDSYGACTPDQVAVAVSTVKESFPGVTIGFHGHDNLELAFANSLSAAHAGATVLDSTMTGMGRGPGNTKTELLLIHQAATDPAALDFVALDSAVHAFDQLRAEHGWGSNLAYMIAGASGLPQREVMDWLGKNRYSVAAIVQALHGDNGENIDSLEHPALRAKDVTPREVLVLGGGETVTEHIDSIVEYARATQAVIVHANYRHLEFISRFDNEQYVCVAGDVAARLPAESELAHVTALVVPNAPRFRGTTPSTEVAVRQVQPFAVLDAESLGPISDTGPLALALGCAISLNAGSVTLLGFDGYRNASIAQQELAREIQAMIDSFAGQFPKMSISSATKTMYSIPTSSVYSRLMELH